MLSHLLVSIISDDKPGVVETLAETISSHGGNWLESSLSQLYGKFAGVVRIAVNGEDLATLEEALCRLSSQGLLIKTQNLLESSPSRSARKAYVHVLGPDRTGIVKELSKALVKNAINLASLETSLSSMPYSGDPLFEARGQLELPVNVDIAELHETLEVIADTLALDISFSETPFED